MEVDGQTTSQPEMHEADQKTRVAIGAPLDLCYESAEGVIESIRGSVACRPATLALDLGKVRAMDSSGLKAVLQGRRMCEEAGIAFEISAISDCAARVIRMSGFDQLFEIHKLPTAADDQLERHFATPVFGGWKTFEHVVESDPSLVAVLREKAADVAIEAGLDGEPLCDIRIAVGEALSNAYKHGSPNQGADRITMRCMSCPQALVIEVQDEGHPFDPSATTEPDPKLLRDHGMGLYLMRQAMDVVEFRSNCPGNRVRMVKWLK